MSFEDASEQGDEIFLGELISIEDDEGWLDGFRGTNSSKRVATFRIKKKWKGNSSKIIKVYQYNSSCGFRFSSIGGNYMVYAHYSSNNFLFEEDREQYLTTNQCTRNATIIDIEGNPEISLLDEKYPFPIKTYHYKNIAIVGFLLTLICFLGIGGYRWKLQKIE